jgi:heptosyltransferase-2
VLVLCGPGERDLARRIVALAGRPAVASLADRALSLGLTKACVRRCDLLVTTDSGPRHFAQAFDRPVVTLFGPTHIPWTETYYPRAVHLQKKVVCGPCQLRVCPYDHRCMRLLSPAEVFMAAEELLERQSATLAALGSAPGSKRTSRKIA